VAAPRSATEFCELVLKSELIGRTPFEDYCRTLADRNIAISTPADLADSLVRDGVLTRFQTQLLLRGRWKNFFFGGKYKVLDHLGTGGMGSVFLCEHRHMRRRVAVKLLPPNHQDPEGIQRFRREAQAIAMLDHPNIVRAFDIDNESGLHFIVMEYIDGASLQSLVDNRGPLEAGKAVNYLCQAACGLQHAADMGLVHRDVKPSNLMLDTTGTIKLLDLGLARIQNLPDQLSSSDGKTVLGTADYLAPEQARRSAVDIRADIYALGAVAYYLMTGHPPFTGGNVSQKLVRHQSEVPQKLNQINPAIPAGVADVVSKMLMKSPNSRHQNPRDVVHELTNWLVDIPAPMPDELPGRSPMPGESDTRAKLSTISMVSRSSRSLILKTMVAVEPAAK
jgi:eukaryotic-like serine/threonine-protein kinase